MWSRTAGRCRGRTLGTPPFRLAVPLLLGIAALALAAPAAAQPSSMTPPSVYGEAIVGQMLVGFPGVWTGVGSLELEYQWRRCPATGPCADITGASSLVYSVAPDDAGHRLQLRVTARGSDGTAVGDSELTERVPGASTAADTPVPAVPAVPAIPAAAPVARRARLLEPFPEVRIRGWFTMRWTRFTLVTVRAPVGAAIAMRCTGRGCPFGDRRRIVTGRRIVRLRVLERRFRPKTAIVLRITKPGRIGKATRISILRGRRPGRWDGCVMPGSAVPVACPLA